MSDTIYVYGDFCSDYQAPLSPSVMKPPADTGIFPCHGRYPKGDSQAVAQLFYKI